jgi:hypothetical protein
MFAFSISDCFTNAFDAASSITFATSDGFSKMTTWHVDRVVVTAPIFFADAASIPGGSIQSFADTIAHVGLASPTASGLKWRKQRSFRAKTTLRGGL